MANSAVVGVLKTMLTMDTAQYEAGAKKAASTNVALNRSLENTSKEISKITPQAERMVKSLGGDKLLYTANSLTQAITKLGGATRLSEAEQVRANKTLSDAIAKYTLLGQKAPQAMVDLEKETRKSTLSLESLTASVGKAGAAIGISLTVGAVVAFARSMGEFAGQMNNLSAETGIGVERLQQLNYIAAGVDLTIEDLTTAIAQLQNRLGSDDKSAVRGIERLGMSLDDLKGKSPDEVLISISDGFKNITNQNERTALAMDLFGRSGVRMLRLFQGNMREMIREAEKAGAGLSKELIDKADQFDSAWDQAIIRWKAKTITAFDYVFTHGAKAAEERGAQMRRELEEMADMVRSQNPPSRTGPKDIVPPAGPSAAETRNIEAQSEALKKAAIATEAYRQTVARLYADIGGAASIQAAKQLLDAWNMLSPSQQANSVVVAEVLKRYEALRKEVGTEVVPALERLFRTTGTLINQAKPTVDAINAIPAAIGATSESITADLIPSWQGFAEILAHGKDVKEFHDELVRLGMILPDITDENDHVTDSVERQTKSWDELADKLRQATGAVSDAAIGHLGTLLFGVGNDNRELKHLADQAHNEFLAIQASGKATAEQLTLSFQHWREAEERAEHGFSERFKDWAYGLGKAFMGVLDSMLQYFTESFLKGILKSIAGSRLGQAIGNWAGGFLGGGGSGGGGLASSAAQLGGTALLGGGGGGTGLAGVGAAGGGAAAAGGASGAGTAGAAAGGIGMGATIGLTAGIGGAALLAWAIWKKGLFRGGEESLKVNKPRDKFIGQFGSAHNLAAKLTSFGAGEGGGNLMMALNHADKERTFHSAEDNIIAFFAQHGVRGVKKFNLGGFVPPGAVVPAILHGGSRGEYVVPAAKMATDTRGGVNLHVHNYITAMDRAGVRQFVESNDFIDSIDSVIQRNHNFITTRIDRALKATP